MRKFTSKILASLFVCLWLLIPSVPLYASQVGQYLPISVTPTGMTYAGKLTGTAVAASNFTATTGGIVAFNAVYVKSDGTIGKAQANAAGTAQVIGVAPAAITQATSGSIVTYGPVQWSVSPGWTPGGLVYLDGASAGGLTQTVPVTVGYQVVIVGTAIAADTLFVDPIDITIELGSTNSFMPVIGGTFTGPIHVSLGTIAAAHAPFYFTTGGALMTTAEAGAFEVSNNLSILYYSTAASTRKTVSFLDSTMTGTWNGTTIKANYLQQAAADLGAADVTVNLSNSNGAYVTNLTIDGVFTDNVGALGTGAHATIANYALLASPTFTTQIIAPQIYGDSAANGDILIYVTLSGTKTTSLVTLQAGGGNVAVGAATDAGTSGNKVIVITEGTAPTTSPANTVQLWEADRQGVAGKGALHMRNEEGLSGPVAFTNLTYRTSAGNVTLGLNEIGNNYLEVSAAGTVILPPVPNIAQTSPGSLVGAVITIYSTTAAVISIDPNAADRIVLYGVAQADGEQITCDAVAGNSVTLICDSVAGWRVLGTTGVWINGG